MQILSVELGLEVHIARVLGELDKERAAEVLPMLHRLVFVPFELIDTVVIPLLKPFLDARQQSGRPVTVEVKVLGSGR